MRELPSGLGRQPPEWIDVEADKRTGWRRHGILVIAEHDPRLSWPAGARTVVRGWKRGVERLGSMPAPKHYPEPAWRQLVTDAAAFLERWAAQASALGWQDWELFGCHRSAPWGRIQGMGLALLLGGGEVVALADREAAIRTPRGARQTYRRKVVDPLDPAERCLVWELAR